MSMMLKMSSESTRRRILSACDQASVSRVTLKEWLEGLAAHAASRDFRSRCKYVPQGADSFHEFHDMHQWHEGNTLRCIETIWELDIRDDGVVDILDAHIVDLKPKLAVDRGSDDVPRGSERAS